MKKTIIKFNCFLLLTITLISLIAPTLFPNTTKVCNFAICRCRVGIYNVFSNKVMADSSSDIKAVLTFDDGYKCVYENVYPVLDEHDYTASIPIIGDRIGEHGYLNYKELSILYRNGYEILNHSYHHRQDKELNCADLLKEYQINKYIMTAGGFFSGEDILIAPGGKYYNNHAKIAEEANFKAVRTLKGLYSTDEGKLDNICMINVYGSRPIEDIEYCINEAVSADRNIILIFHKVTENPPPSPMFISVDEFKEILDILSENNIEISSYNDLLADK